MFFISFYKFWDPLSHWFLKLDIIESWAPHRWFVYIALPMNHGVMNDAEKTHAAIFTTARLFFHSTDFYWRSTRRQTSAQPQSGYIPWKKERGGTTVLTIRNVSAEWGRVPSLNRSGQRRVPGGQHLSWELRKENEAQQGLREEHFRQGAQQV